MLSISKRENVYLRILLIQGARAVLNAKLRFTTEDQRARKDYSKFTEWMFNLSKRRSHNIVVVAVVISWQGWCLQFLVMIIMNTKFAVSKLVKNLKRYKKDN